MCIRDRFIGESNIIEGIFIEDYLVEFDGQRFECVDKGFDEGQEAVSYTHLLVIFVLLIIQVFSLILRI